MEMFERAFTMFSPFARRDDAAAAARQGADEIVWLNITARGESWRALLDAVERAVDDAGLQACHVTDAPDGLAPTSVGSRAYEVAAACPGDAVTVVVDRFASAGDRDAAARQFEAQARPRGSGTVLTLADATVELQGSGDGDARRRLVEALRREGAR
jgi:hypothetical protein